MYIRMYACIYGTDAAGGGAAYAYTLIHSYIHAYMHTYVYTYGTDAAGGGAAG
jgi:hypothetical protein